MLRLRRLYATASSKKLGKKGPAFKLPARLKLAHTAPLNSSFTTHPHTLAKKGKPYIKKTKQTSEDSTGTFGGKKSFKSGPLFGKDRGASSRVVRSKPSFGASSYGDKKTSSFSKGRSGPSRSFDRRDGNNDRKGGSSSRSDRGPPNDRRGPPSKSFGSDDRKGGSSFRSDRGPPSDRRGPPSFGNDRNDRRSASSKSFGERRAPGRDRAPERRVAGTDRRGPPSFGKDGERKTSSKSESAFVAGTHERTNTQIKREHYKKTELLNNESLFAHTEAVSSFRSLNLIPEILSTLDSLNYTKPTAVQQVAIPKLLEFPGPNEHARKMFNDVFLAAETGGGKTLAYLIPLLHKIKKQEKDLIAQQLIKIQEKEASNETAKEIDSDIDAVLDKDQHATAVTSVFSEIRKLKKPRAIIVVPTRELVAQVTKVAKQFTYIGCRIVGIHSYMSRGDILPHFETPVDILVASPGAILKMMGKAKSDTPQINPHTQTEEGGISQKGVDRIIAMKSIGLSLENCATVIVDEADTMFDTGFGIELDIVLKNVSKHAQHVFVSATLPQSLLTRINNNYPEMVKVTTPKLHHTSPGLKQYFLKVENGNTKEALLLDVLRRSFLAGDEKILVFCNTKKSVDIVGKYLLDKKYDVATLQSSTSMADRKEILEKFSKKTTKKDESSSSSEPTEESSLSIVVATDIASRGLDTTFIDHVVLFDCPMTSIDYLHRVGRTARNGAKGKATSLVCKRDIGFIQRIENFIKKGVALT